MLKWNNVFVYTGDDFFSHKHFKDQTENLNVVLFDADSDIKTIEKTLFSFNIFSNNIAVKILSPNAEILKLILENISNLSIKKLGIFLLFDSLDLRMSFSKKAKEEKRIFNFNSLAASDNIGLKNLLKDIPLTKEALTYILNNAPTKTIKIKETKKDLIIFDLYLLQNELNKLTSAFQRPITEEDLSHSQFENDLNIFQFIGDCFKDDIEKILNGLQKLNSSHGHQATLMILLSQLNFLFYIGECKEKKILENQFDNLFYNKEFLNKYYDQNYIEIKNIKPTPVNPIRIKIALNEYNLDLQKISTMYLSVVNSIIDLRSNINEDIVFPRLAYSLGNKIYIKSLYNGC